jgi:hypothetical protein
LSLPGLPLPSSYSQRGRTALCETAVSIGDRDKLENKFLQASTQDAIPQTD